MDEQHRVLVIAHGHPDINPGGGEHAAYVLFRELRERSGVSAMFMAREESAGHPGTPFGAHDAERGEVALVSRTEFFRFSQRDRSLICRDFRRFLESFRPTIVHFHHYVHLGIELLREVRNYSRTVPIVLTLHEYLAICNNSGQMVTTRDHELCRRASPSACSRCFPDVTPEDFFLREIYLKSFLSLVDVFVSPSEFLVERYVSWGLPREKFVVIENGVTVEAPAPARPIAAGDTRGRFAFFGQISEYKGLHVLLEAMTLVPSRLRGERITLDIHGAHLERQTKKYQDKVEHLLEGLRGSVRMHGRYHRSDLPALMRGVDWVVVPSTWWENSPMVIQEALAHGRPVICSDIGGMAEKVKDGETGLHFRVGNARHLADRLIEAATSPDLWTRLHGAAPKPWTVGEMADRHLDIYDRLAHPRRAMPASLRIV